MKLPTETGTYPLVPREDYDRIRRERFSHIKQLADSPAHYRHAITEKQEDTDPLVLGRATHLATFEPERFLSECVVYDGGRRYGKEWDKFRAQHEGREIITEGMYEAAQAISTAARADAKAAPYLSGGLSELTVLWTLEKAPLAGVDPGYRFDCKGRLDFVAEVGAIVDLKTCQSAEPEAFLRSCIDYAYREQAAFYQDGYFAATGKRLPYVIVAVEKAAPHVVQVFRMSERALARGRERYQGFLDTLAFCKRHNKWPGYADGEVELDLAVWEQRELDEDPSGMGLEFEGAAANG